MFEEQKKVLLERRIIKLLRTHQMSRKLFSFLQDLEQQMADLEKMLKDKIDDLNGKRKSNADLKSAVKAKEKELRFQVSLAARWW